MKQSTKLLSILLSLVMLMSIVSVVGHAKLVKNQVQYNAIDGAELTVEQVANLALDALDKLLYDAKIDGDGKVELDLKVTKITLRLDSIDHAINDLVQNLKNNTLYSMFKGLLGDAANLKWDAIAGSNGKTPVQRSGGDLNMVYQLVQFLYDNKGILKKIVYGIGTSNGISLGSLANGLIGSNLDSINDIVKDLPGFLTKMVFGALLHNETPAYLGDRYDPDSDSFAGLPTEANTIDKILNTWIYQKLAKPVEFTRDADGNKVFTPGTEVSKQYAAMSESAARALTNVNTNSILQILDNVAQIAFDEFGVPGINFSLKHVLMDIMGADALEISADDFENMSKYAAAKAEYDNYSADVDANYLIHDCFFSDGDNYYYSDLEERKVVDTNGNPILDQDGKEQFEKTRTYYVFDLSDVNEFFELVDWDYDINNAGIVISDLVSNNGSILGSLNSLIYTALTWGINPDVFDAHDTITPDVTCVDDLWYDGGNEEINDNLLRTVKWVLVNYTAPIFGRDSVYWDAANDAPAADFVATVQDPNTDLIDLVAYIGLPLFTKYAMPQMVFPKNADGTYNLDDGLQVLEFGAAVIQELITDVAPYVNYTDYIYTSGSFTSASGRTFANHTADEWVNLILNMGIDLGYYYLNGITNFNTAIPAQSIDESRWMGMLDAVITWGADYIGGANAAGNRALGSTASNSVLSGYEPNTIAGKTNAIDKLNYALNRLLPLGFLCDLSGNGYDVDINRIIEKVKNLATDFDLSGVLAILGRNTSATDSKNPNSQSLGNILSSSNVVNNVLKLAQRILYLVAATNLLPNGSLGSVATLLTNDNLSTFIDTLLTALNNRKTPLLCNALPVVAQFIKSWGGEQSFGTPSIGLSTSYECSGGALADQTFAFTNGSAGVWRHYKDQGGTSHQDEQYKYKISTVKAYNFNGTNSSYITIGTVPTSYIDYGSSVDIPFSIANVPAAGAIARIEITYQVTDEFGNFMADGQVFKASMYTFLSREPGVSGSTYAESTGEWGGLGSDYKGTVTASFDKVYAITEDSDVVADLNGTVVGHVKKDSGGGGLFHNNNVECQWYVNGSDVNWSSNGISFDGDLKVNNKTGYDQDVTMKVTSATATAAQNLLNSTAGGGILTTFSVHVYAYGGDGAADTENVMFVVYNNKYLNKLVSLLNDEADLMRTTDNYKTTGTAYASEVIDTTPDADGLVATNFSTTGVNPDSTSTDPVTAIDCATAWSNYTTALQNAFRGARQSRWNSNSIFNFEALYKALYTAAKDVEYLKKSAAELAAEGGADLSADVAALKANLESVVDGFGGKRATDYAMHRWSRLTDARDDAESIINKAYNAHFTVPEDVYFPYTGIADEDLTAATFANANYKAYTLALRRAYTAAQMVDRTEALKQAKLTYAQLTKLDVYQAQTMLTLNNDRLLPTTYTAANGDNAEKAFLANEISSATAEIGTTNTQSYTARSWARYTKALAAANTALTSGANKVMFDAKYELQCARNALKTAEEEADYTELEALMAQAQAVLANAASYTNTNKDFGHVLAALGMDEVTKADGTTIQLFPGSASIVNANSYWADDQRSVDRASDALRAALANMRLTVTGSAAQVTGAETATLKDSDGNTLKDDEGNDKIADFAKIDAKKTVDQVKALFTNLDSVCDGKVVSLNATYAISLDNSGAFTGTGSTLTFYKTVGGVNIPVATIHLVVEADVNGDGILDALDARTVKLTQTDHAYLSGLFFIAANLDAASEGISAADFSAVVNKVVASA